MVIQWCVQFKYNILKSILKTITAHNTKGSVEALNQAFKSLFELSGAMTNGLSHRSGSVT